MLPPTQERSFHFLTCAAEGLQNGTQRLLKWRPGSPLNHKDGRRDVYKACSNRQSNKLQNASQMGAQVGGPKSVFFDVFEVSSPRWAPGRPWTDSKAPTHAKMEHPRLIFKEF